MTRLAGRTAIVTGGGRGIGAACAERFAAEGASVVVADIDVDNARERAEAIVGEGGRALGVGVDVADVASIAAMVAATIDWGGGVDILLNNAGIVLGNSVTSETATTADWDRLMTVNVRSMFFTIQAVTPHMKAKGSGRIINLASTSGYISSTHPSVIYDTSKGAVRQLTVSSAYELAPFGINVNAIAPGTIKTALSDSSSDPAKVARIEQLIPLGRLGSPDEVGGAAVFLASDDASYVCGHTLVVDGGRLTV